MKRLLSMLFLSLIVSGSASAQRLQIDYHSSFLVNLHHFLFDLAVRPAQMNKLTWTQQPSPQQMRALQDAVAAYRADYGKRDILEDAELRRITDALSRDDTRTDVSGLDLPPRAAAALAAAAPVYRQYLWIAQDRQNQDWIAAARKLDAAYGAEVQAGIERLLQHPFPARLRMDVVVQTGDFRGAYTNELPPHTVMPSGRADYQGYAALEMLYHEASHVNVVDTLSARLDAAADAAHKPHEDQLWHALQFATVGAVTREVLARQAHVDYLPYAEKRGLFRNAWPRYQLLLDTAWKSYMAGQVSLDQATARMFDGARHE